MAVIAVVLLVLFALGLVVKVAAEADSRRTLASVMIVLAGVVMFILTGRGKISGGDGPPIPPLVAWLGAPCGVLLLLGQVAYCWYFKFSKGWRWLLGSGLLWPLLFVWRSNTMVRHNPKLPSGLDEFMTIGPLLSGCVLGLRVLLDRGDRPLLGD